MLGIVRWIEVDLGSFQAPFGLSTLRNPSLALLANETINRNRKLYPTAEIEVVAGLSSALELPRQVDLLVTETFGSLLLGEGVLGFVKDARHVAC